MLIGLKVGTYPAFSPEIETELVRKLAQLEIACCVFGIDVNNYVKHFVAAL